MKLTWNTPIFLGITVISVVVYILDIYITPGIIAVYFTSPSSFTESYAFLKIISYPFGHRSWIHLATNYSLLLLVGQILEKRYSALQLISVILFSIAITGCFNTLIGATPLSGSDGLTVCMILLISLSYVRRGELPLSIIAIIILLLLAEIDIILNSNNLSRISIIVGAILSAAYGLTLKPQHR